MDKKQIDELLQWGKENIDWAGGKNTNKSDRHRFIPEMIVNHMSQGTATSCIEWFNDPSNDDSSAHFLIGKDGRIYQFVAIEDNAWGNGITAEQMKDCELNLVKKNEPANPNWYTVSVEHEGRFEEAGGKITIQQMKATIMLHRYIIAYVLDKFSFEIKPSRDTIVRHSDINPIGKPYCPGEQFPIKDIISALNDEAPQSSFSDITGHWAEKDIIRAKELGIVRGFDDGTFRPDEIASRAQVVSMMMRLLEAIYK